MLEILVGCQVESKSQWLYHQMNHAVKHSPTQKQFLIVPEQFTVQAEKSFLAATQNAGLLNPEVLSFDRFAYRVFQETGGRSRVVIDDLGKHILIRKILIDLGEKLHLYKDLAREKGFVEKIADSITECKQYDISPEVLKEQAELFRDQPILMEKLLDLAVVFQKFEDDLADQYVDQEDQFEALIMQISQADFVRNSEFWIDGFYSFTPKMLRVVKSLAENAPTVKLTSYGKMEWFQQDDTPLITQTKELLAEMRRRSIQVKLTDVDEIRIERHQPLWLKHLTKEFDELPIKHWTETVEDLTFFAAANDDSEIERIGAEIKYLVQEKGYRYRDISVLCADLDQRHESVERIMSLLEIPYFLDVKRKQIKHPLIQLVPAVLNNIAKGYTFLSMFSYLKKGYTGISRDKIEMIENETLSRGIRGHAWKRNFSVSEDDKLAEKLNEIRKQAVEPLEHLEKGLKNSKNVRQMTYAVYEFLEGLRVAEQVENESERCRQRQDHETAAMVIQLWNRLMELMDQLVEMTGNEEVSLREYEQLWQAGVQSIEIGIIPPTVDQVMIGTPERSRQAGIRALFLLGVNDGVLPAVQSDSGLLLATEKSEIQNNGCVIGLSGPVRQAQESLLIKLSLSRPSELLWISYSQASIEGEARRPSVLFVQLRKMFPNAVMHSDLMPREQDELHLLRSPVYSYLKLAEKLRDYADGKTVADHWHQLHNWFKNQEEWKQDIIKLTSALFYSNQPPKLKSKQAERLFGSQYKGSVSRLEQFNRCPFAHFIRYGLEPRPRKQYAIMAPDIGSVLHDIMDSFGKSLQENGLDASKMNKDQIGKLCEGIVDQKIHEFQNGIFNSSHRFRYQGKRLKRITERAIDTMAYHLSKSSFQPADYEIIFGRSENNENSTPFHLETESGLKIMLEGRIDRLDQWTCEDQVYCQVIDYKSGNQDFSMSEVMHGIQLQLLVYMMAALKQKDEGQKLVKKPAGMFYFYLDDPLVILEEDDQHIADQQVRKKLRMRGLVLKDLKVIREMDHEIDTYSDVLPVGLTSTGDFTKGSSLVTENEFDLLQRYAIHCIGETAASILGGIIVAEPAQLKQWRACHHCEYECICQYDDQFVDNQPRKMADLSDQDALQRMIQKLGVEEGEHNGPVDK